MNRAKIMLSALGVLAIIGSALAFEAHKVYLGNLKCAATTTVAGAPNIAGNLCTNSTYSATSDAVGGRIRHCKAIDAPAGNPCVVQLVNPNP